MWSARASLPRSAPWPESFDSQFRNCDQRIIVTTFASNVHRIQTILNVAHKYGRKVAVTGREHGEYSQGLHGAGLSGDAPEHLVVDINARSSPCPRIRSCIVSTGSQGENMSALYRMAFSGHRQVEIRPGRPDA